jgi:hypothetical protein
VNGGSHAWVEFRKGERQKPPRACRRLVGVPTSR